MANDLKLLPQAERLLSGTISASMDETQTTVDVSNPPATTKLPTYWEIEPDSTTNRELVRITGVSSNTITLERGLNNGGTGFSHSSLSPYKQKITSLHWDAIVDALESGYLTEDASYTLTRVSTSSFKVTASGVDRTGHYTEGRRVRINGTVVVRIISSSYSNPDTTVIVDDTTVPTPITSVEFEIATKGNTDTVDLASVQSLENKTHVSPVINTSFSGTAKATATTVAAGTNDDTIVTPLAVAPYGYHSMARQAIMNSNFSIWQRGITSGTIADSTTVFLADRWFDTYVKDGGTLPTLTRTREILTSGDIPNAYYYSRLTTNGAGTSLGTSSRGGYFQRIENGTRNLCGASKTITLSFWARSSIASKRIGFFLLQNYGTGGSPTTNETINGTNWTLTSTWTKYTHTFTTNTLVGKTFGTADDDYIGLQSYYIWGTNGYDDMVGATTAETFGGSGTIDIAQVQVCAGDVALPFEPKSDAEEKRDCQRYCLDLTGGVTTASLTLGTLYATTATNAYINIPHPVDMRIAPSVSSFTPSILSVGYASTGNIALTNMVVGLSTKRNTLFTLTTAGGMTVNMSASLFFNTTVVPILLTAEL